MTDQEFSYDRGVARLALTDGVDLTFDYLRMERGELHAELTVANGRGPISRSSFNLSSLRARTEMARYLGGEDEETWRVLLEGACLKVTEAFREGAPAVWLREAQPSPVVRALLPPLLLRRDPVVLFGDGGTAKSYLGLALALSVAGGLPIVGGMKPSATLRTAYLDFEWNVDPHVERLRKLLGDEDRADVLYVPCDGIPLVQQVDRLRRIFAKERIEYAVLDSVMLACDGPAEEADTARRFFQALGRLEVGSALIAHITKLGEDDKPFGSVFWHNSVRGSWFVQKVQEVGSDMLLLGLHNRKANGGPLLKSLGLRFDFGERTTIRTADVYEEPDLAVKMPVKARLVNALRGGPVTVKDLADNLSLGTEHVRSELRRGRDRTFRQLPDDKWALATARQVP